MRLGMVRSEVDEERWGLAELYGFDLLSEEMLG